MSISWPPCGILHLKHDVKPIYFPPQLYYLMNFLTIPKGMCPAALPLPLPLPLPFPLTQ